MFFIESFLFPCQTLNIIYDIVVFFIIYKYKDTTYANLKAKTFLMAFSDFLE